MTKIKEYFAHLPFSFKNAGIATIVLIVLMTLQVFIYLEEKSKLVIENFDKLIIPTLNYTVWLAIAPLMHMLIRELLAVDKDGRFHEKRNLSLFTLSVAFTFGHELIGLAIYNLFFVIFNATERLQGVITGEVTMDALGFTKTYLEFWILFFILQGFHNQKKVRLFRLKNAQLESDLLKARMSALKNQLHPHFLFNTFNTISSLMDQNTELAQRMIAKLGALLRKILKEGDSQFIAVREETELARLYLEVEQIRFDGRLVSRFAIDPMAAGLMVPTLILQPLVENAIKHGFYKKTGECEIAVKISRASDSLILEVKDNGGGIRNEEAFSFGIGLENIRERLMRCYADDYQLSIDPKPDGGGFCVEIRILEKALYNENISSHNR